MVRTCNSPHLLKRYIHSIQEQIQHTKTSSKIILGIADDSTTVLEAEENANVLAQSGIETEHVVIKDQSKLSLLQMVYDQMLQEFPKEEAKKAIYYFFSEHGNLTGKELKLTGRLNGQDLGGGHASTANISALISAYMLGLQNANLENSLFTNNDDDILYQQLCKDKDGNLVTSQHDYFLERQELFENTQALLFSGRYTGVSGSPISAARNSTRIVNEIIENRENDLPQFPLYDEKTGNFQLLTGVEAYNNLPQIIDFILQRSPNIGFKINDKKINSHHFSQGNYSLAAKFASVLPSVPGGVPEMAYVNMMKTLLDSRDLGGLFANEPPVFHHRVNRQSGNAFEGNLLQGAISNHTLDQLALEKIIIDGDSEVIEALHNAFGSFDVMNMNFFGKKKEKSLEQLLHERFKLQRNSVFVEKDWPIYEKVLQFLEVIDENKIQNIAKLWEYPDINRLKRVKKATLRFIRLIPKWNYIYNTAYRLGKEGYK